MTRLTTMIISNPVPKGFTNLKTGTEFDCTFQENYQVMRQMLNNLKTCLEIK